MGFRETGVSPSVAMSLRLGGFLGGRLGRIQPRRAGILGGAVLLFIGVRLLLEAIL